MKRGNEMAAAHRFKIYSAGIYRASCRHPEDAAILIAALGGEIRDGHRKIVWNEGSEAQSANESYDFVAATIWERLDQHGH
jgi:hypothetical protein